MNYGWGLTAGGYRLPIGTGTLPYSTALSAHGDWPPEKGTVADLELEFYEYDGTISDGREVLYSGDGAHGYWAGESDIAPPQDGSLSDHQKSAYLDLLGLDESAPLSKQDLARMYWLEKLKE